MSSPLLVMKFGGTSVQDAPAISRLVEIVRQRSGPRLVVVSALAKVTDSLLRLADWCEAGESTAALTLIQELRERHLKVARELGIAQPLLQPLIQWFEELTTMTQSLTALREVSPRSRDRLVATGELCSSCLVSGALAGAGLAVQWVDVRQSICTDSQFGSAQVDFEKSKDAAALNIQSLVRERVVVTQGFIGANENGLTTTLGRGGSDYSAAVLGALLHASKVEIWTDVDGILSTDPRVVPEATILPRLHFSEAAELAYLGAKVLHPATIYPALERQIPVWILNSKNPQAVGTEITFTETGAGSGISGIAFKKSVTLVNIYSTRMLGAHGFLKSVFDIFARHRLSVDLISTSEVNVSLTLDPHFVPSALVAASEELGKIAEVKVHRDRAMVAVVGRGIRTTPGLAGQIFSELKDINIQMISMGASELNISFVVDENQMTDAVQRLHRRLIPSVQA